MSNSHPTLINLPPPPSSDAITPSDVPGTPNSATTSMSELSTVAIKDGHRGHLSHHQNPMDAERADRISRLAGLERIGATAVPRNPSNLGPAGWQAHSLSAANPNAATGTTSNPPGTAAFFDHNNNPQIFRERSTVGSASATGSVGGRTTWASGSDVYDPDKMSEDQDIPVSVSHDDGDAADRMMDADETASSVGGLSDEASLVGFGEGARTPARTHSAAGVVGGPGGVIPGSPLAGKSTPTATLRGGLGGQDARIIDGVAYDQVGLDGAGGRGTTAAEQSERIIRERLARAGQGTSSLDGSA